MALTTNTTVWKILLAIFLVLTGVFALCFYFSTIFITIIFGIVLIVLTEKVMTEYTKRMKKYGYSKTKRKVIGFILLIFWILAIFLLLWMSGQSIATALANVGDGDPIKDAYYAKIEPYIPQILVDKLLTEETIESILKSSFALLGKVISSFGGFVANAVLIVPLLFYMYFRRGKELHTKLVELVPKKLYKSFKRAIEQIETQLHDFIEAKVLESVIIGAICCLGFYVIGVKGWLILGVFAGFLNIVPYIGPIIGAIPPIAITLVVDSPLVALYVVIVVVIAQIIDNVYLVPFMVSGKVKMDALLSIILILAGAKLLGVLGMIFAIPVYLVYKIILVESYKELVKVYGN